VSHETIYQALYLQGRGGLEVELSDARFDTDTREAELTVRLLGELSSVVRDREGKVVEGDLNVIKQQRDVWTFARQMGSDNPNWKLVGTGS
jgi:predicted lipid-binding transport protein (Tim44 family)